MEIFTTSVIVVLLTLLALKQMTDKSRSHPQEYEKTKVPPFVILSCVFSLMTECVSGRPEPDMILVALVLALAAMLPCSFSLLPPRCARGVSFAGIAGGFLCGIMNLVCLVCGISVQPFLFTAYLIPLLSVAVAVLFVYGIWTNFRNLKMVMKSGSVWTSVCLGVDAVYIVLMLVLTLMCGVPKAVLPVSLLMAGLLAATSVRIMDSSAFVLWKEQERRIVESMKIAQPDAVSESPGMDLLYKNIYERVLEYFEKESPYLNHELTMNDVVAVVFTNKLYISRAISRYTGRNFCQFVNYYRVMHAVETFRKESGLKIVELASRSGFNSAVSFNMAFRLFMGEKPGDWCRKERVRLERQKK